ncbi:hypothetical protein Taro_044901 [Colocasia esculenta]|uniref:Uncharacterized protein n=1 Tax=Colocasia esculenta TaxID=4460 RepID=A0A843WPV7_COLES|nr:hypothetical protein [Colocasia esculenta]
MKDWRNLLFSRSLSNGVMSFWCGGNDRLCIRAVYPFLVHKGSRMKFIGFWLTIVQIVGCFNLTLGLVMSINYLKSDEMHPWQSCYVWAGLWVVAYVLNEVHEDIPWVQVTSRFLLLVMVSY